MSDDVKLGFWNMALKNPDQVAIVDPGGEAISFKDLAIMTNQVVHGLRSLGLESGDCIALLSMNQIPMVSMTLGCHAGRPVRNARQLAPDGSRSFLCRGGLRGEGLFCLAPFSRQCGRGGQEAELSARARASEQGTCPVFARLVSSSGGKRRRRRRIAKLVRS